MAYKLHANGVVTGSLNSFCLACQTFLKSEHEAYVHIGTTLHCTTLGAMQYSDKFKDEHIRKFKGGYYCEFCNVLLPIAAKVNVHVAEENHQHNKATLLLKPMGEDVVALNNILIEEKAWHTLNDGICSVCNDEFDDENEHKSDASHSLNLVLRPVKFDVDNAIYRHLEESAVQCLTCNEFLAHSRMTEHFNDPKHLELYAKRRIEINGVGKDIESIDTSVVENKKEIPNSKKDNDIKINKKPSAEEKSKVLESIVKYQSKGVNINLEADTAFCKKCSEVIPFESMEIENHIESHSLDKKVDSELLYPSNLDQNLNRVNINDKSTKKTDDLKDTVADENIELGNRSVSPEISDSEKLMNNSSGEEDTATCSSAFGDSEKNNEYSGEARAFAKENQLTYNEDNNQSYCRICEVKLPSSFRSMKEHVAGATHKKLAGISDTSRTNPAAPMIKQQLKYFLDSSFDIEGLICHDTVLNEEFCIPQFSFWLISTNNSRHRCLICEMNLPPRCDVRAHVKSRQHSEKMAITPVIISETSELIREIRTGVFHCGYCNLVLSSWNDMQLHLKCSNHKEKRASGERRLEAHLPGLQRYKMQQSMEAMRLMWLLDRFC